MRSVAKFIDAALWTLFLVGLVCLSFLSNRFDSLVWQTAVGVFYIYCGCYAFALATGQIRYNRKAVIAAMPVLTCLTLSSVWLALQQILPGSFERIFDSLVGMTPPGWYQVNGKISLVPERTRLLMLASIFVLAWFALCLAQIYSRRRLQQVLWVLLGVAVLHALVGQLALSGGAFLVDEDLVDGHFNVARGWFVNRNHFASLLVIAGSAGVALAFQQLFNRRSLANGLDRKAVFRAKLLVLLLSFCLILLVLLQSQSRAGLLSPMLAIILLTIASFCGGWRMPPTPTKIVVVTALTIVCILTLLLFFYGELMLQRLSSLSLGERVLQWRITFEAIRTAPWLGYGGGAYATVLQATRDHAELRQVVYNQSHNEYLHIWLEQGLVGLLFWLGIIFYTAWSGVRSFRQSQSSLVQGVVLTGLIGCLSTLLQACVDFNLQVVNLRSYFFLLIALIFVAPHVHYAKAYSQQ